MYADIPYYSYICASAPSTNPFIFYPSSIVSIWPKDQVLRVKKNIPKKASQNLKSRKSKQITTNENKEDD